MGESVRMYIKENMRKPSGSMYVHYRDSCCRYDDDAEDGDVKGRVANSVSNKLTEFANDLTQ